MNTRFPLAAILSLLVCAFTASAQNPTGSQEPSGPPTAPLDPTRFPAQIGAFLEAHHAHRQFNGTALVADHGKIIYQGAFGRANEDWNIANRLDTKFRLGSITKQFTAMLVLLLVEAGRLELDAPIIRYLPDYPSESGSKVTIHHLLNHTSGIPQFRTRPGWQGDLIHHLPVEDFVARFCSGPLESEPGAVYRHNNNGYYLLGAIVEAVTGQRYGTALRERVLDPLAMHDTGHDDQYAVLENRATGYEEVLGQRRIAPWVEVSNYFASDGLYSTVGDLWKWEQALRNRHLLSGKLEERMFTPGAGGYGYGWHIDDHGIWHGGAVSGFSTMIGRIPSRGQCVILLSNSGFSSVPEAAQGIAQILKGNAPDTPAPRPEWAFAQSILDNGIDASLEALAELPQSIRDREVGPTMHFLGHRLLEQRRAEEAVLLFEFNTRAFPKASERERWLRFESLADAHAAAGHLQLAIDNYHRALDLNPASTRARSMLEKLEGR